MVSPIYVSAPAAANAPWIRRPELHDNDQFAADCRLTDY